jgi:ribonuclease HI
MTVQHSAHRIRIIQHNCAKSQNVMHSLLHTAHTRADIVLIQEPWISPSRTTISHPSFTPIIPPHSLPNQKIRTMAFISRTNPYLTVTPRLDITKDADIQILEITTPSIPSTQIINLYNERFRGEPEYTVPRTLTKIQPYTRTLLLGDFNAHSHWWDDACLHEIRHEQLTTYLTHHAFDLLNEPDEPTHHQRTGRGYSVIDLAFATPALQPHVSPWTVLPDSPTGSDHEILIGSITSPSTDLIADPRSGRYNWQKATEENWHNLGQHLRSHFTASQKHLHHLLQHPGTDFHNLELAATLFRDILTEAVNKHIPPLRPSPRAKIWWTETIDHLRTELHRAQRHNKQVRTPQSLRDMRRTRNLLFRTINKTKNEKWTDFLNNAKGKDVFTALRYTKPRLLEKSETITTDTTTATTTHEKIPIFKASMFPPPPSLPPQPLPTSPNPTQHPNRWEPITDDEIRKSITTSHPHKAPGPDGLSFSLLQRAYEYIPETFHSIYRALLHYGYHPRCWRQATVAIIRKPGKPDYSTPKAYRPISLLNCLGKISEKLMATRLTYLSESLGLLHHEQMGGRPGRSAVDAALLLTNIVDNSRHRRHTVTALFMDVKGAFDNVAKARLLHTLTTMNLPTALVSWVDHFLTDRHIKIALDGEVGPLEPVMTGIPQGSPISPILFLLYLKPLFDVLKERHPELHLPSYIDDVSMIAEGKTEAANLRILTAAAKTAFEWGQHNAVIFDDPKSELMHFHRRPKPLNTPITLPNGTVIAPAKVLRWLGTFFDRKLQFHDHVQRKIAAATRAFQALARLANTETGLPPSAMRQLYMSCVTTISDFSSETWWNNQPGFHTRLKTLQHRALRRILGAFKTSPTAALECEAAIPPPGIRLDHKMWKYAIRVISMDADHPIRQHCPPDFPPDHDVERWAPHPLHCSQWNSPPSKDPYVLRLDRILSSLRHHIHETSILETTSKTSFAPWFTNHLETLIPPGKKDQVAAMHKRTYETFAPNPNHLRIYTDGSKLGTRLGASIHIPSRQTPSITKTYSLGEEMEVFDAELFAVSKAFQEALRLVRHEPHTPISTVTVFLDNQAVIKRLQNPHTGLGQALCASIYHSASLLHDKSTTARVEWVPGHHNVHGNEQADLAAKYATTERPLVDRYTSLSFLKREGEETKMANWVQYWRSLPPSPRGHSYEGYPRRHFDEPLRGTRRLHVATIIQLRTGHGYFGSYFARFAPDQDGDLELPCFCGARSQTPEHLLLHCPRRGDYAQKLRHSLEPEDHTLTGILHTNKGTSFTLNMIKHTGIATRRWRLAKGRLGDLLTPTTPDDDINPWATSHSGWGRLPRDDEETRELEEDTHNQTTLALTATRDLELLHTRARGALASATGARMAPPVPNLPNFLSFPSILPASGTWASAPGALRAPAQDNCQETGEALA